MKLLRIVLLWLTYHMSYAFEAELSSIHGGCSRKCQTIAQESDQIRGNESRSLSFPCSCNSSCSLYKDCCYDSPFRKEEQTQERRMTMCISLSGTGQFRAVSKCPREWLESPHFCTESIGYLPPVTSKTTGTTYANIYCAVCHGDDKHLKTWNVELRCCPEHEQLDDTTERRFIYRKGHLWSRVSGGNKCLCKYFSHDNDVNFLSNLELRTCDRRLEISKCSPSWSSNSSHQDLCRSFLDPIYVDDKIYRNRFCAQCNFKRLDSVTCAPGIVEMKLSEGLELAEIFQFCLQNRLGDCLYYLSSFNRGRMYPFSSLLNIHEMSCMPSPGMRCCEGERYDFKAKKCRKLHQRS